MLLPALERFLGSSLGRVTFIIFPLGNNFIMDELEFHLERLTNADQDRVNAFVADWLEVESIVDLFEEV